MRQLQAALILVVLVCGVSGPAGAQALTGNISGRVTSPDGMPLPGVTVTVAAPTFQGSRTTATAENGSYLLALLPPGTYTVTFELDGFRAQQRVQNLAGTQNVTLDAEMSPAVTEQIEVVGQAQPFVATAQVATSYKQDLMAELPTNRTLDTVLLVAPAVHPTGPRGAFTINGSQSYENLFLLNGAVINENLRGAPMTPYIEDALQEVTVASAGISAEYGRFSGGVATAVTRSGGNTFSGSFRTSFANDNWRSLTPFQTTQMIERNIPRSQLKADSVVPTYEATLGGPVSHDRLWFFAAMRSQEQVEQRTTLGTSIPYERRNDEQRYEGKLTFTPRSGHAIQGSFLKLNQTLANFTGQNVADLASLVNQRQPQSLVSAQYTGVLTPNFSLSAQYSARRLTFADAGASATDRINGTLVLDLQRGWRYWSPTFCAGRACGDGDEQRNNENVVIKGSYFVANRRAGTHHVVFGYDYFNDNIIANTHPSGSDYRVRGTTSVVVGQQIFPVWLPGMTTLDWNPLTQLSEGTNLRVHSLFANDTWRLNDRVTLNLGLRFDKNDATDGDGRNVGDDLSVSPRLSAVWDPNGQGQWAVSGSLARYTMALTANLAGATARGGNAATYRWLYTGPAINAGATPQTPASALVTTDQALQQIFAWHDALGGNDRPAALAVLPGVNMAIDEPLSSPYAFEYAGGVSRAVGQRGTLRADLVYRDFRDFYALKTDLTTGRVSDPFGNAFDRSVIVNTPGSERTYIGLTMQASYDMDRVSLGGNYTLSNAQGNLEGETVNGGPSGSLELNYPEYRVNDWNAPTGSLAIDQRHRARLWATYQAPISADAGRLSIGLLQQMASGVPYAPIGIVNPTSFVANPGYLMPPPQLEYFFEGRDPYRTEATFRTDLSVNYGYRFSRQTGFNPELFVQGQVLNVFNQFQLCGCGENVFRNGGPVDLTTIATGARVIAPFNPYATQPVEGVHWQKLPTFGTAQSSFAYTSPRIFRFSVGLRF